jgi:hypothetical protein
MSRQNQRLTPAAATTKNYVSKNARRDKTQLDATRAKSNVHIHNTRSPKTHAAQLQGSQGARATGQAFWDGAPHFVRRPTYQKGQNPSTRPLHLTKRQAKRALPLPAFAAHYRSICPRIRNGEEA